MCRFYTRIYKNEAKWGKKLGHNPPKTTLWWEAKGLNDVVDLIGIKIIF